MTAAARELSGPQDNPRSSRSRFRVAFLNSGREKSIYSRCSPEVAGVASRMKMKRWVFKTETSQIDWPTTFPLVYCLSAFQMFFVSKSNEDSHDSLANFPD
ncbi:hypothetical protein BKA61DRAFT_584032 [Leptodontidium sp. MPI-SDFR-AT-0119]|nr:hypothetical protein BKA61DRAFT_584032 [Leptodontidium sp. MPI-SDFR-AT-0119]